MKRRKGRFALLSMLLAASMLASCSAPGGSPAASSPGAGSSGSGASQEEAGQEEKPVLKVLGYNASFDPNEDLMASEIEKVTGYQVEYYMLPMENADEKLNIELSSGSKYDILNLLSDQYFKIVGQGALLPLDDLLAEYGQNILSAVKEETWKACEYDGSIYSIPLRKEYPKDVTEFILVREDILEEIGEEIPTTLDEFYQVLQAIKEKRPDLIPLTGPNSTEVMAGASGVLSPTINSAFGIYTDWQEVDGKLLNTLEHPRIQDSLSFMSRLYEEGLIDPDWPINTGTTINEKFTSGKAVMTMCNRNTSTLLFPVIRENFPDAKLGYILPLIGENGEQGARVEDNVVTYSCIPRTSEHAEDAVKFMDLKQEPDNFLYLTLGEEGKHFTMEDGQYIPIMPIFSDERTSAYWYLNSSDEENYPTMWMARVRKNDDMWDAFEKVSLACSDITKANPLGYMPPNAEVSKYQQSLDKMANDFYLKVIAGAESLDSYGAFVQQWKEAGGDVLTEEINAWYSEYYG